VVISYHERSSHERKGAESWCLKRSGTGAGSATAALLPSWKPRRAPCSSVPSSLSRKWTWLTICCGSKGLRFQKCTFTARPGYDLAAGYQHRLGNFQARSGRQLCGLAQSTPRPMPFIRHRPGVWSYHRHPQREAFSFLPGRKPFRLKRLFRPSDFVIAGSN